VGVAPRAVQSGAAVVFPDILDEIRLRAFKMAAPGKSFSSSQTGSNTPFGACYVELEHEWKRNRALWHLVCEDRLHVIRIGLKKDMEISFIKSDALVATIVISRVSSLAVARRAE